MSDYRLPPTEIERRAMDEAALNSALYAERIKAALHLIDVFRAAGGVSPACARDLKQILSPGDFRRD